VAAIVAGCLACVGMTVYIVGTGTSTAPLGFVWTPGLVGAATGLTYLVFRGPPLPADDPVLEPAPATEEA
jgi:hypothetical protein